MKEDLTTNATDSLDALTVITDVGLNTRLHLSDGFSQMFMFHRTRSQPAEQLQAVCQKLIMDI